MNNSIVSMFVIWLCWRLSRNPLKVHSDIQSLFTTFIYFLSLAFRLQGSGLLQWYLWLSVPNIALHGQLASPELTGGPEGCFGAHGHWGERELALSDPRLYRRQSGGVAAWSPGAYATFQNSEIHCVYSRYEHELTYYVLPRCREAHGYLYFLYI